MHASVFNIRSIVYRNIYCMCARMCVCVYLCAWVSVFAYMHVGVYVSLCEDNARVTHLDAVHLRKPLSTRTYDDDDLWLT